MNIQNELSSMVSALCIGCAQKDATINAIEKQFQCIVDNNSKKFSSKTGISVLNIYKSVPIDKYKIHISFEEEPLFLGELTKEIKNMSKGGTQISVKFEDVILYWITF